MAGQQRNYQPLKNWVEARGADEAANNRSQPLRTAQQNTIAELTNAQFISAPTGVSVDDRDYISILQYFVTASQPGGTTLTYNDAVIVPSSGSPSPLWTQSLTLTIPPLQPLVFPPPGRRGFQRPCFARKKDAQKYCAKLCVDHLVSRSLLVPDPSSSSSSSSLLTLPAGQAPPKRRGVVLGQGAVVDPRDDRIPATQRVPEMCRLLGLQAPAYRLDQVGGMGSGVWSGEADFGRDATLAPEGIGRVERVFGWARARESMAEDVLEWLFELEEQRLGSGGNSEASDDSEVE